MMGMGVASVTEGFEFLGMQPPELSATGLVVLAIILVLTGRLVPFNIYKAALRERDDWKEVAIDRGRTIDALAQTARENTEPAKVMAKIMTEIQNRIGVDLDGDSD